MPSSQGLSGGGHGRKGEEKKKEEEKQTSVPLPWCHLGTGTMGRKGRERAAKRKTWSEAECRSEPDASRRDDSAVDEWGEAQKDGEDRNDGIPRNCQVTTISLTQKSCILSVCGRDLFSVVTPTRASWWAPHQSKRWHP